MHLEAACRTLRATEVRGRPSASSPFVSAQLSSRAGSPVTASGLHSFIHPSIQPVSSFISYLHTAILAAAFTGKRVSEALTTRPCPPDHARTHTLPKPASLLATRIPHRRRIPPHPHPECIAACACVPSRPASPRDDTNRKGR